MSPDELNLHQCKKAQEVVHGILEEISSSGERVVTKSIRIDQPDNACFKGFLTDLWDSRWHPSMKDHQVDKVIAPLIPAYVQVDMTKATVEFVEVPLLDLNKLYAEIRASRYARSLGQEPYPSEPPRD